MRSLQIVIFALGLVIMGFTFAFADSEHTLTTTELQDLLTGKEVYFPSGTYISYKINGKYTFNGNPPEKGTYTFRDNKVCIKFIFRTRYNT